MGMVEVKNQTYTENGNTYQVWGSGGQVNATLNGLVVDPTPGMLKYLGVNQDYYTGNPADYAGVSKYEKTSSAGPVDIMDEKSRGYEQQQLIDDERAFALSNARETYNALEPSGPAWSPNDSQFYTPENIPGSEDTALLPVPSLLPVVLIFAIIFYYVKGK